MNKTLAVLALILMLSTASCGPIPTEQPEPQPEPLVLPYVLYEQEYHGNQVKITLVPDCMTDPKPDQYCFDIVIHAGEGQTTFGAQVITVVLTEGYQKNRKVDWKERIGDNTGSGTLTTGPDQPGLDHQTQVGFLEQVYPVAVFVRLTATEQGAIITGLQTDPPLAVLQILPDGQGVVRLDE